MTPNSIGSSVFEYTERIGRTTLSAVETFGHWAALVVESIYWLFLAYPVNALSG